MLSEIICYENIVLTIANNILAFSILTGII